MTGVRCQPASVSAQTARQAPSNQHVVEPARARAERGRRLIGVPAPRGAEAVARVKGEEHVIRVCRHVGADLPRDLGNAPR